MNNIISTKSVMYGGDQGDLYLFMVSTCLCKKKGAPLSAYDTQRVTLWTLPNNSPRGGFWGGGGAKNRQNRQHTWL